MVEAASIVANVPVGVDLGSGAVVGVVGDPPLAAAVARSLVLQLVVAHGPADLLVAGLLSPTGASEEACWMRWFPHASNPASGEALTAQGPDVASVLSRLHRSTSSPAPGDGATSERTHLLLVVDDPLLLAACNTPARRLLASDPSAAALIVTADAAALPSICDTVVEVRSDGTAAIHRAGGAELADQVAIAGASIATAMEVALALAGWHDPEQPAPGAGLPHSVALGELVGAAAHEPEVMRSTWEAGGSDPPLRTLLAAAAGGPVEVDLVRDGPHALIAGTTGAGKSELLRSLVAGSGHAHGSGPPGLRARRLQGRRARSTPALTCLTSSGVVTDLDEHLAERALRSLRAELRRRETHLARRWRGRPDRLSALRPGAPRWLASSWSSTSSPPWPWTSRASSHRSSASPSEVAASACT